MKFLSNKWQYLTIVVFVILLIYMILWGHQQLNDLQVILMYSLIALAIHQFEEYILPGGGPIAINKASFKEESDFSRFPANALSTCIINLSVYIFYILALIFPQLIWLGLATMIFNLMQLVGHGYSINKAMGTWYNPGLVTSVILFAPISIYYIFYIYQHGLISIFTWVIAIVVYFIVVYLTINIPMQSLKNRNSKYPFSYWQIEQYDKVEKFCRLKK